MATLPTMAFVPIVFTSFMTLFLYTPLSLATPAPVNTRTPYRLDGSVKPYQYYIYLKPDLDAGTFHGQVKILVRAEVATNVITLHSEGNTFAKISVKPTGSSSDADEMFEKEELDSEQEFLILQLSKSLDPNTEDGYAIAIDYDGTLREDMYGFYISTYHDPDGTEQKIAATHFQPTHARKAFPCFDEPSFKARFQITLVVPDMYFGVSNMMDNYPPGNEYIFGNSHIMSTYLVAFAVINFGAMSTMSHDGNVLLRVWSRNIVDKNAFYGLYTTADLLEEMEKYTNYPYTDTEDGISLKKIDQVALPDFAAGAMEDWGLILYRESRMLLNLAESPRDDFSAVATVIAHEISHQWYGNLVTTAWWDALWLNEGFATYFESYLVDKVNSTFRKMDMFVVENLQAVMISDAATSAQPLTYAVSSADETRSRFNSISYSKGGVFLRLISSIIGEDNFQAALRSYLRNNKYKSVLPKDFFAEILPYVGETGLTQVELQDFLEKWTTLPGFPVITVQRNYNDQTARVSQARFLYKGASSEVYYVPLTWTDETKGFENVKPIEYLKPNEPSTDIRSMPSSDNWILFNVQETGYYRVNYDERNWKLLTDYLKDYNKDLDNIHVLNRAQLLDDAFNLARAGLLPYSTAFELATYLPREHDYVPWAAVLSAFSHLDRMFASHTKYSVFQRYIRRLVSRQYARFELGFRIPADSRQHDESLLFNRLTTWACASGHQKCRTRATNEFLWYMNRNVSIAPDLRSIAYCYGISGTPAEREWDDLFARYNESEEETEKARVLKGLACTTQAPYLKKLLAYAIDGIHVRKQSAASVFSYVYATPSGAEVALEFLRDNFQAAQRYLYINVNNNINTVISGIASRFTTTAQKTLLENFVNEFSVQLGGAGSSALTTVQDNIDWVASNEGAVFSALERIELEQYRLPKKIVPRHHNVTLTPEISVKRFMGEVNIKAEVLDPTDTITLHANVFSIASISVRADDESELYDYVSEDSDQEYIHIYLTETIQKGIYYITIKYDGTLRDDMYGFYYSTYSTSGGESRTLLATQFQPTHARKAFPCFDEPQYKATFDITINNPSGLHSLSNMPSGTSAEGSQAVFPTTMEMSSYLVAFVVSDFEYVEDKKDGEVLFRTWARPDALPWAQYSLQVSRPILNALEDYTNIKYTSAHVDLNKIDQVAIPDFSAGAMENWGLITYRETALLYNDGPASAKRRVATTIAHELVHMWFGNLVTTKSWDSTWLNEGFAQYFQYYSTNEAETAWRIMDQFLVDVQQAVFRSDMLASAQALTASAYTPAQISARFGTITYSKGASFIRMLNSVLGPGALQQGLRNYLSANKFGATEPKDLFHYLEIEASAATLSQEEMRAFLGSWTEQSGFPLVTVTRDYNERTATVTQTRFLSIKNPDDATLYYVPLTWAKQGENFQDRRPQAFINNASTSITIKEMPDADSWVIFNVQETGYYRVNYDERNWALLARHLAQGAAALDAVHVLNRAQLLDDAFNLARGDHLPYATAFAIADYLEHEADFVPWTAAATAFNFLDVMLAGHEKYNVFQKYILHLLDHQYERFLFKDQESHEDKVHLNRISNLACNHGHEHCKESAKSMLEDYLSNGVTVPGDLRSVVYCHGLSNSAENWDKLWEKYKESLDDAERSLIANGLGCSTDSDTLKKYLQYSIDGEHIRKQDASSVFSAVYTTRFGVEIALEFLNENFQQIQNYYGSMGAINNIVTGIASRLTTEAQKAKLEALRRNHEEALGAAGLAAIDTVAGNLEWLKEKAEEIFETLDPSNDPTEDDADGKDNAAVSIGSTGFLFLLLLAALTICLG